MKKLLVLLLCCFLLAALAACAEKTEPSAPSESTQPSASSVPSESNNEAHDHNHIGYKGLESVNFTIDDAAAAEGRTPDFSVEQSGTTIYIYNDVTLDELTFTQVQYTFSETGNRISCTYTADSGLDEVLESYKSAMTALYGEPTEGGNDNPTYTWHDHTANFVMLTQLNDTTVQLAFYLCEGAQ